jgi:hypothetical protein
LQRKIYSPDEIMKNQFTKKFRLFIFFCLFCVACASIGFAQNANGGRQNDPVVAAGNGSLRQSDVKELRDLFEWLFETTFSLAERTRFQTLIIQKWNESEKEARGISDLIKTHRQIQTLSQADREKIRLELLPKVAASFESGQSELNDFMSGIYQNSRKNSAAQNDSQNPADGGERDKSSNGAVTLADLTGTWSSGSISGERYKNLRNNELSDVSGNMSEYIISPNGQIEYTGYLSTTIYACSTRLFFQKKGKISVSGSSITFDYKTGERDYQNSCNASLSGVKPIPPSTKTVSFTLEREGQNVKLCTSDEGAQTCLYKVK